MNEVDRKHVPTSIHGELNRGDTLLAKSARGFRIALRLLQPFNQRASPTRDRAVRWCRQGRLDR